MKKYQLLLLLMTVCLAFGCFGIDGNEKEERSSLLVPYYGELYTEDDLEGGYLYVSDLRQSGALISCVVKNVSYSKTLDIIRTGRIFIMYDGEWYYVDIGNHEAYTVASDNDGYETSIIAHLEPQEEKEISFLCPDEFAYAPEGSYQMPLYYVMDVVYEKQHWIILSINK